jgi:hypothetical protein
MAYSVVSPDSGHVALGLAIRRLDVSGTFMQAPAHPDDETNALFAMFTHGMGLRSVDVQNNRGEGGQNEIGPELFRDIGVLRTSELLAAHRIDGAEQYFTRAIDYGYSFDPEEVVNKWGRETIVGDYVRLIRTLRPDVLLTMSLQGRGGDRAHEATTILAREAYRAAGNPAMYPEQIREGLRPWQPRKLYFSAGGGVIPAGGRGREGAPAPASPAPVAHVTRVNTGVYDALLGRTYAEIGVAGVRGRSRWRRRRWPVSAGGLDDPGPTPEGRNGIPRRYRHHTVRHRAVRGCEPAGRADRRRRRDRRAGAEGEGRIRQRQRPGHGRPD